MLSFIILFCTNVLLFCWLQREKKQKGKFKIIPGPYGLPVLGHVLQIGRTMHLKCAEWAYQYGKIYQIRLGNQKVVIVSDPVWVKEMFSDPDFSGRNFFEGLEIYENEPLGIASIEGKMWQVHRRFLMQHLRDFGYGKQLTEQRIRDELLETLARLRALPNGIMKNFKSISQIALINSLWQMMANERFEQDDPKIEIILDSAHRMFEEIMKVAIVFFIPWTRWILPVPKSIAKFRETGKKLYIETVESHKRTLQADAPRDFIDVYLTEMNANKDNPDSMFYGDRAERQLHVLMAEVLVAGTDTTSATLSWGILYLTKFKTVQEKLQREIDFVTEKSRYVTLDDRPSMPYTMAVIEEIFRVSSTAGVGAQHRAVIDKEFKGYLIEKDTWIFPNLYFLHHNIAVWGDPKIFRPERFLSADERTFQKNANVMPFQIGRRQCIGKTFAEHIVFLFLANIFQRFSVSFDPDLPEPDFEPTPCIIITPKDFSVKLTERSDYH